MLNQSVSKYGLATHLAIAAGLPVAMSQFVSAHLLGCISLWLSLYAALWIVMEPSVFSGETVSIARRRVLNGILRDPFAWFLSFAVLFCWVRWLNSGLKLAFDAEASVWAVRGPLLPLLPASAGDAAFLPFAAVVVMSVVVIGVKHSLGRNARVWFGVFSSAITAVGGMAAAICAGLGMEPFGAAATASFGAESFPGTLYALFLLVAIACGVEAEERGLTKARLVFAWSVAGNIVGTYVFLPAILSLSYLGVALLVAVVSFAFANQRTSTAAMARSLAMFFFGVVIATFAVMVSPNKDIQRSKGEGLSIEKSFPVALADRNAALRRISKSMWLTEPWSGVGIGGFPLQTPFNVVEEEWMVLPPEPKDGSNLYFTLIAERGIVGALMWALWIGFLLWFWVSRLIGALKWHGGLDEGRTVMLDMPTVVWIGPVVLALAAVDAWFSVGGPLAPLFVCVTVAMSLSAASFPRRRRTAVDKDDNRG